jgi:hypothetical protein
MYTNNNCSIEGTKEAILLAMMSLGAEKNENGWISVSIAVEKEQGMANEDMALSDQLQYKSSCDGKGLKLKVEQRPGEGPACTSW